MSMVEWIDKYDKRGRYDAIAFVCAMTNKHGNRVCFATAFVCGTRERA